MPLIAGILLQWNQNFSVNAIYYAGAVTLILFAFTEFLTLRHTFQYGWARGVFINLLLVSLGAFLTYHKDVRHDWNYFANFYKEHSTIVVTLLEPPEEKENSFKAVAAVNSIVVNSRMYKATGKIILYFKKDSSLSNLHFGSTIILNKPLNEIKNTGNPGAFDYKRYCLFNGITHQVYLTRNDFLCLEEGLVNRTPGFLLDGFLIHAKETTISVLRRFIKPKKELGLAEALLIGYKDDLDKGLIQSYTNTGVVHIIAISGQHLALIYWLLLRLLSPLKRTRALRWLSTLVIISILWLFSLMTGAQPSIIRAALMCTIMLLADSFSRKSNTLNSLSCSAFLLLCFNPFDLWDVGFQLSFAGLLSLVLFTRPVYNLVYVENIILRHVWQLVCATIAAQILTTPVSIYHFHQFPFSFLLTNLLAVPLSSLVLVTELLLFVCSFVDPLAVLIGKLLVVFIWLMNTWVERIEGLHGLLWDGLHITIVQTILLYLSILGFASWLLNERKNYVWTGITPLVFFFVLLSFSFRQSIQQKRLVVYNVAKHHAVDIIDGRKLYFIGDEEVMQEGFLKNFNIKPARTLFRAQTVQNIESAGAVCFNWYGKRIVILNKETAISKTSIIDLLIISKEIPVDFDSSVVRKVVIEATIPRWKARKLEEELDHLHIPFHDVNTNGAFILNFK